MTPNETSIRDTLFGDAPIEAWAGTSAEGEPWRSFAAAGGLIAAARAEDAEQVLEGIVNTPGLESRHYLEAWLALRSLGREPPPDVGPQVLGVVVEVGLEGGLDLLAAYRDRSARYHNFSGAGVVWEHPDRTLDPAISALLRATRGAAGVMGVWDEPRPGPPPMGQGRINLLTPSGLRFGQGDLSVLAGDAICGPILAAATILMQELIAKTRD